MKNGRISSSHAEYVAKDRRISDVNEVICKCYFHVV
jgi:hypothetical protein